MLTGRNHSRKLIHFSPAESKVFIVFLYYIISGALELTTFSIDTRDIDHNIEAAVSYFNCQKNGYDNTCSLDIKQNPVWSLMAFVFLMLFPAVNLIYAVKFSDIKAVLRMIRSNFDLYIKNTVGNASSSTVESSKL